MNGLQAETCTPNINLAERRKRLMAGVFSLAIGLVILIGMLVLQINPLWRLALFPIFAAAASGYFQWREKT